MNRYDVYANCALGVLSYARGRENKDLSKAGLKEQQLRFQRAGEFFEQAIKVDNHCAFAAQGLAIAIAEGRLGTGIPELLTGAENPKLTEIADRAKNARDALTILHKVKDSINSGGVYVNIGHCHFLRDEWERAIESVSFFRAACETHIVAYYPPFSPVRNGFEKVLRREERASFALPCAGLVSQGSQRSYLRRYSISSQICQSCLSCSLVHFLSSAVADSSSCRLSLSPPTISPSPSTSP